jgi:chromosomal replication initiation ATPase DnaA
MKFYISGKKTEVLYDEVVARFEDAEILLESLGLESVNPIKNVLPFNEKWKKRIIRDIENLLDCDAILMLDGWTDSVGASIEYDIAMRTGKDIWFESTIVHNQSVVLRIQNAIHEATGMRINEYTTKSRKRDDFFARMIFAHHCRQNKMKMKVIANYIHRDHTSMLYLLKKYNDECRYNPHFRALAQRVESILNKTSDEKA